MRSYFDHNATTPPDPAVVEAVVRALSDEFGNPSSVHHFGQRAKALLDEARSAVAERPHHGLDHCWIEWSRGVVIEVAAHRRNPGFPFSVFLKL